MEVLRILDEIPHCVAAIRVASPSLHRDIIRWQNTGAPKNRGAALKTLMYLLRMASRSTPYGIFAAIGAVRSGPITTLQVRDTTFRASVRPDMGWLFGLMRNAAKKADRSKVPVHLNDLKMKRGDRVWFSDQRSQIRHRQNVEYRKNAINPTDATAYIEGLESIGSMEALEQLLTQEFSVEQGRAAKLLLALARVGYFNSDVCPAPLGDIETRTAERLLAIAPDSTAAFLTVMHKFEELERTPISQWTDGAVIQADEAARSAFAYGRSPLHIDLGVDFSGELSARVLADAQRLGNAAMRMSQLATDLDELRNEFQRRYEGNHAVIPLLDLVDPDFGLDVPDLGGAAYPRGTSGSGESVSVIALLSDAIRDGAYEVCLSQQRFEELFPTRNLPGALPESIEISFRVHAATREALDAGDYLVAPGSWPGTVGAGRSLGRFLHLLGPATTDAVRRVTEHSDDSAIIAELVYLPPDLGAINKSARPRLLRHELQVGLNDDSDGIVRISPSDIYVGLKNERFYLWSKSLAREVRIRESHLLLLIGGPSIIRFLSRLPRDGKLIPGAFPWGPAMTSPFTPRVRSERVVLSPARWRLPMAMLRDEPLQADRLLRSFAERWSMPDDVLVVEGDISVPVRLSSSIASELIKAAVGSEAKYAIIEEQFGVVGSGWLGGSDGFRGNEFVATLSVATSPRDTNGAEHPRFSSFDASRTHAPLSQWVYARLDCAHLQVDDILQALEPTVAELKATGSVEQFFFVRYSDPDFHLRLRFKSASNCAAHVRNVIYERIDALHRAGATMRYSFQTYLREVERYGGIQGVEIAEAIFSVDSTRYLETLPSILRDGQFSRVRHAVAAAVPFVRDVYGVELNGWLERNRPQRSIRLSTAERQHMRRLLEDTRSGESRRDDYRNLGRELRELSATGGLTRPLDNVVSPILHMHFNRYGVGAHEDRARAMLSAHFMSLAATGLPA